MNTRILLISIRFWSYKRQKCLLCPTPFVIYGNFCFYFSSLNSLTALYADTQATCLSLNSSVPIMDSQEKVNTILNANPTAFLFKYFWVTFNFL